MLNEKLIDLLTKRPTLNKVHKASFFFTCKLSEELNPYIKAYVESNNYQNAIRTKLVIKRLLRDGHSYKEDWTMRDYLEQKRMSPYVDIYYITSTQENIADSLGEDIENINGEVSMQDRPTQVNFYSYLNISTIFPKVDVVKRYEEFHTKVKKDRIEDLINKYQNYVEQFLYCPVRFSQEDGRVTFKFPYFFTDYKQIFKYIFEGEGSL